MDEPLIPNPKILLVEDDSFLVGMYVTKLEMAHFVVFVAMDADHGLEIAKREHPDLILLDVLLPGGMDGFGMLEELKADADMHDIPVIMLTNLGQEKDERRGRALGAIDYLVKAHFLPSEVIERILKTIKDARARRAIT